MLNFVLDLFERLSGQWKLNFETKLPRMLLYKKRIASSRPSLGYFVLLISSAIIATLGLISNSTAVVIGAMIVAPLMDPILSLAYSLVVSDGRLMRRSAVTVLMGVITVVATAALISSMLDVTYLQSEIIGRTSPNLIDLAIAIAAAVAGSFSMTRENLSNSIAGVAIAVALVPPLCVVGIGLTLGNEVIAVFGRGTIAGLTNQIAEGSFLLFLANLIGIAVASLLIFLIQGYGSLSRCWKNLFVWFGFLGLLCVPLSSALRDFRITQGLDSEFRRFKSGQVQQFKIAQKNIYLWKKVRLLYSNISVRKSKVDLDLVLNAPEELMTNEVMDDIYGHMLDRSKDYGLRDVNLNLSVIPNRSFRFQSGVSSRTSAEGGFSKDDDSTP